MPGLPEEERGLNPQQLHEEHRVLGAVLPGGITDSWGAGGPVLLTVSISI